MTQDFIFALLGGILIGISVTMMLYLNGRVTGISGIVSGLFSFKKGDWLWRLFFILGLVLGGITLRFSSDHFFRVGDQPMGTLAIAGFLVGFGTVMGSGCTSGHGVCGMSRFSKRSFVATILFILSGFASVAIFKSFI